MTRRQELFEKVHHEAIIGVVREDSISAAWEIARTLATNGIRIVEITMTTPDAVALIKRLADDAKALGVTIAAGTIRSGEDAAEARRAGAEIIVSPHTDRRVIEYAVENDMLSIAGAATATEIVAAWDAGADIIKIYPALHLGGPAYISTIRQPIRDIPMLAGGPVPLEQIEAYLEAGAIAVNLGASLAPPDLVRACDWTEIGRRAALATSIVKARRIAPLAGHYVH